MRFTLKNYQILNLDVLQGSLDGLKEGSQWDFIFELNGWCSLKQTSVKSVIFQIEDSPISPVNVELLDRPDLDDLNIDGKGISIWLPFYLFTKEVTVCKLKIIGCNNNCYSFVEFELHADRSLLKKVMPKKALQFAPMFSMGRSGSTGLLKLLKDKDYIKIPGEAPYETRVVTYLCSRALLMIRTLSQDFRDSLPGCFFLKNDMLFFDTPDAVQEQKKGVDYLIAMLALKACIEGVDTYLNSTDVDSIYVEKISSSGIECLCLLNFLFKPKGIILLRDLRDLICSTRQYKHRFPHSDFTDFSTEREYQELAKIAEQMLVVIKMLPNWKVVRYEQLINDPKTLGKQLDHYFGKKNRKRVIRKDDRVLLFEKNHITSESAELSVGRWKNDVYFMEKIDWFNKHLKDLNESLGYQ